MAGQGLESAGITWAEMGVRDGSSPNETWELDAVFAQRTFKVRWEDRNVAAWAILGYGYVEGGTLKRYLPEVHPEFPWLSAHKISATKGIGWRGKGVFTSSDPNAYIVVTNQPCNVFEYAALTVDYSYADYEICPDDYLTNNNEAEHFRYVVETTHQNQKYLSYPQGGLKWVEGTPSAGQTVIGSVGKVEVATDYVLTWKQVPEEAIPFDRIDDYAGKVNSSTFRGKPPHTMLFLSGQRRKVRLPFGMRAWEMEYTFKHFAPGHNTNFDFRAPEPSYYQIANAPKSGTPPEQTPGSVPDGKLVYDEADMDLLFAPE